MVMEARAELSVEFLSGVLEQVAHPIFVKDRRFRFVLVNQALCEMVGYERTQLLGKTDYDFFPTEQADFFRSKDQEMFATGASVRVDEELITDRHGRVHVLATTKVPQRSATGEVTHLVGIIHDVTEIKRAEEALQQANDELERRVAERTAELTRAQEKLVQQERLTVLGHLAGGLAHQLRNPLGIIQNAVALVRKGQLAERPRQALDIIEEEIQRADGIIRDLLDYARIKPPERREVALREVVEETLQQCRLPSRVRVDLRGLDDLTARLDPLQLQTALGNIVRNALEAMPDGGELRIDAERDADAVRITVSDSGRGIAADQGDKVFDPLITTKPLGSGLGLSTARCLVENHGGTIALVDSPLGGASFLIELPLADAPASRSGSALGQRM